LNFMNVRCHCGLGLSAASCAASFSIQFTVVI
jgi:hypothetical protein